MTLAFLISFTSTSVPASSEPTNLDVLLNLMAGALDPIVVALSPYKTEGNIAISPKGDHQSNWLVESSLLKRLAEEGFSVIPPSEVTNNCEYMLSYEVLELGVNYLGSYGSIWGKTQIKRLSKVDVSFEIHDLSNGEIIWLREVSDQSVDSFDKGNLELIESATYEFARSEFGKEGILGKILEPIVISAVLGWVIYLFYTTKT